MYERIQRHTGKNQRRDAIDTICRLVFTIDRTLTHSRDVLTILDDYRENAGEELKHGLNITVADMRSNNTNQPDPA